jgi:outer membrane protein assembly factor BamE
MRQFLSFRRAAPVHFVLPAPLARASVGVGLCLALGACGGLRDRLPSPPAVDSLVTPYRIDILQGNVVTREQAQALRPGMSREQVRNILGSPLLTSVFHGDRWDYVFTFKRQGQPLQQRRLTLFFKGEALERQEADDLPSESEFVSTLDVLPTTQKPPRLEASEAELKAFQARSPAPQTPTPVVPDAAPTGVQSYPPLEPTGVAR